MGKYVDALSEIFLERARYLLNTDELVEEMLDKTRNEITDNIRMEICWNAGTICFGTFVDTDEAHGAQIKSGEPRVCCNITRKFVSMATA